MDRKLLEALRRKRSPQAQTFDAGSASPLEAVSFFSAAPAPFTATPAAEPELTSPYCLDPTGDYDVSAVECDHVRALEQQLAEDPEAVLSSARQFWDARITEPELRSALEKTRVYLEQPATAVAFLESAQGLEVSVGMPPGWGFEGYDPRTLPISPMDTKFETAADAPAYASHWLAAMMANAFKPKPDFPRHSESRPFVYDFEEKKTKIGVLGDFGNGLPHARYIAKHLRASRLDHLLYLGDVYYCGTSSEYQEYVAPEIEPFLTGDLVGGAKVNVMMLNSNHEMFSKGYGYFSYMRYRLAKGAPQCQEGSYFALRFGRSFQIIGVDTDYHGYFRFRDQGQSLWLKQRLMEGRRSGAVNVLLTANQPFEYGEAGTTELLTDMRPFLPWVDLWLWGNTHYCGLFDRTATLPVSSCLGHGGYPYKLHEYKLDKDIYMAPCPATPLFLETRRRYDGTNLRPDLGNNGYALMYLEPGAGARQHRIRLEYWDWMKRLRYWATLGRDETDRVAVLEGQEM